MMVNIPNNEKPMMINHQLKSALDSLVWNINKDWDFVIIITGDGMVRTGKSVLALQISAYLASRLKTKFDINNVFFDSIGMIEFAQKAPMNSIIQYDEAREALATAKRFSKVQQDLVDFFNECGQLNHIFILVLPDFFSLNWELATNRSELLINVYREEVNLMHKFPGETEKSPVTSFQRGKFQLYNKKTKSYLYWKAKQKGQRQYNICKSIGPLGFGHYYPIDQDEYRLKKKEALMRFSEKHKEKPISMRAKNQMQQRDLAIKLILDYKLMDQKDIAEKIGLSKQEISNIKQKFNPECPISDISVPNESVSAPEATNIRDNDVKI